MRYLIFTCLFLAALTFSFSCRKDKKAGSDNYVKFEKIDSSDVSQFKIKVNTSISCSNLFTIKSKGFCWSKYHMPSIKDSVAYINSSSNSFSYLVQNLNVNTKYYFRSFATNEMGIYYSDEYEYKTLDYQLVNLSTLSPFNIFRDTANVGGEIIFNGGSFITEKGICWSTLIFPTKTSIPSPNFIICGTGDSTFKATIKNLIAGQTYHVRAYAINVKGISYGNDQVFQTTQPDVPVVVAYPISNITKFSANSGSIITSNSGSPVTETGIVWATSPMPDIFSIYKNISFSPNISNPLSLTYLNPNTQYYVRAYAKNNVGIAYSNQLDFTTLPPTLPIVNTLTNKTVTSSNAVLNINVSSDGGSLLQSKGIVIGSNANLDLSNYLQINSNSTPDTGNFSFQFSNLNPGFLFYYRSFATNFVGTSYGSVQLFTTLATLPTLSLSNPSNITQSGANFSITNINDGGSNITSRGIVWDVTPNPTINLSNIIQNGFSGNTNFSSSLSSLNFNTTYYVRAFATNALGTSYSNQISFSTAPSTPIFSSTPINIINSVLSNAVTVQSNTTSNGGSPILNSGFYCSTSSNPNATNSVGYYNNFGVLNGKINELSPGTTYFVRPYASNIAGISYGGIQSFTTYPQLGQLINPTYGSYTISLNSFTGSSSTVGIGVSQTNSIVTGISFWFYIPTVNNVSSGTPIGCASDSLELWFTKDWLFTSDTLITGSSPVSISKINKICVEAYSLSNFYVTTQNINIANKVGNWMFKARLRSGNVVGPWSTPKSITINP